MTKSSDYDVCFVTSADFDKGLIQQIANIEALIQPQDAWSSESIASLLSQENNHCWAVIDGNLAAKPRDEDETKVVAYCLYSTIFETAEVLRIGTHPSYQRRGLAMRLLSLLIHHMPNKRLDRILLEVRDDNHAAISLYNKMGFAVIHTRKGYYANANRCHSVARCDALVMQYAREA